MAERCAFCDQSPETGGLKLTKEHVFPQRFKKYLDMGETRYVHHRQEDNKPPEPSWAARGLDATVRAACEGCNHGWMETLDGEVDPIVAALMRRRSFSLDEEGQQLLVQWALKVAYMVEFLVPASRRRVPAEHRRLARRGILPPDTYLWIAAYIGRHAFLYRLKHFSIFDRVPGVVGRDDQRVLAGQGYILAFSLGHLVVRVLGYPDTAARPLQPDTEFAPWERQLLPRAFPTVVLPPPKLIHDSEWRRYTDRMPAGSFARTPRRPP